MNKLFFHNIKSKGYATVTFTLILPIFLLFVVALYEITQLLHAKSIIVNLGRESAHLISRTSDYSAQNIMDIVASTSNFLDMNSNGVIYINHVAGQTGDSPILTEQFRWIQSGITDKSSLWPSCVVWTSGECTLPNNTDQLELSSFPLTMEDNDTVYVVEVFYKYKPLFGYLINSDVLLSQVTYL